jgi:hypothetical protein
MPFAATSWLSDIVRTSDYRLPDFHPELGDINISAEDLILALASVRHLPIDDSPSAALNPARIPVGSAIPSALALHFEDVVQGLSVYGMDLHPAVRHALLAVALSSPDKNEKLDALKPLMTGNDNGKVYQPTMTWMALLRPEWYEPKHHVKPILRGGTSPENEARGTTSSIVLVEDNMRINAAQMFTWSKPIELTNAKIPAPVEAWEQTANAAWSAANPPATNLWLMSFGDTAKHWEHLLPGAAVYNPFFDDKLLGHLFLNSTQHQETGFSTRMGIGIADLYPLADDASLGSYVPLEYLLHAPLSLNAIASIHHHASSPATSFGVPPAWVRSLDVKRQLTQSLDLMPKYSIFQDDNVVRLLLDYEQTQDFTSFSSFVKSAMEGQMRLAVQTEKSHGDIFDMGLPKDLFFIPAPEHSPIPRPVVDEVSDSFSL